MAYEWRDLESTSGGRLGVYAVDTGSGAFIGYRQNERFAMCSTFKTLAVGAVLARVDAGTAAFSTRLSYSAADIQAYAPIAKQHLSRGYMSVRECCEAAMDYSDNTAANLIVKLLGGPPMVTAYVRSLGDEVTRLDRVEPELNEIVPGDLRDTTSPHAMAADVRRLALGNALSESSRTLLAGWLVANTTGPTCIRAGVPASWRVGDKTGMGGPHNAYGDSDTRNDVAILWPPDRAPIVAAVYLTGCTLPAKRRDAVLARAGSLVAARFVPTA